MYSHATCPNATSVIQFLDQRIINPVKCTYKRQVIDELLLNLELKTKTDVFMAVEVVAASSKVTSCMVIINCFRHAGIKALTAEAASGSESLQHDHEKAASSS